MPDDRTLRQKLEAMASQTRSPKEAKIAMRKLALMDMPSDTASIYRAVWESDDTAGPCPDCEHDADRHAGGMCYGQTAFCECSWSYLGEGNRWRLPKGWHSLSDMIGRAV